LYLISLSPIHLPLGDLLLLKSLPPAQDSGVKIADRVYINSSLDSETHAMHADAHVDSIASYDTSSNTQA